MAPQRSTPSNTRQDCWGSAKTTIAAPFCSSAKRATTAATRLPQKVIEELGETNTVVDAVAYSPARDQFLSQLKSDAGGGSTGTMDLLPLLLMAVNAMRDNAASELATLSGGEYQNFTTRKGFDHALGHLANQVHNFYLLSFQPQGTPTPGYHAIRVSVPGMPDALVRSRSTYWSEPTPPSHEAH